MQCEVSTDKIWFLGRSYQEYLSMFKLDPGFLEGKKVLDCGAGASSFTFWARKNGIKAKATDILYGKNVKSLREIFLNDFSTLLNVHSGMDQKVDWGFFEDSERMIEDRVETYNDFIGDYEKFPDNYILGQLPHLPFADQKFNLALSSHLLFLYDDRLDYSFHLQSIQEMLRVAEEVRIYPIVRLRGKGRRSRFIKPLKEDNMIDGDVKIVDVDYRFREGGNEMMIISKRG